MVHPQLVPKKNKFGDSHTSLVCMRAGVYLCDVSRVHHVVSKIALFRIFFNKILCTSCKVPKCRERGLALVALEPEKDQPAVDGVELEVACRDDAFEPGKGQPVVKPYNDSEDPPV